MPVRAPRICGCGRKITGPCACAEQRDRDRRSAYDATRPSAAARGYGAAWRKIRAEVLASEPMCRVCASKGRRTSAVEVDHADGDSRNNARSNHVPMCRHHHSQRTARDQAFGRKGASS